MHMYDTNDISTSKNAPNLMVANETSDLFVLNMKVV